MACLAPQFKWPPSTSRLHHRTAFRESGRVRCAMTSSAVVEADRPASSSAPSGRHLGYAGAVGPPAPDTSTIPAKFEAALASSALLNEDAVVAAAAAEAVALARTAMEVAKEVAQMVETDQQPIIGREKTDDFLVKEIRRNEMQSSGLDTCANVTSGHTDDDFLEDAEFYSIMNNKCELDDEQYTQSIAVKSARRSERRDWRARTAMKAAKTVSQKPTTCSKKKRLKGCRSPLGCFWKMTGRRLLTSKQEIEFSKGIQDLIKLEAIQTALAKYNGGQPTFSQWAEAAGLDEKTLRKRLDRGIYCKNRMVTSNVRLVISIAREFEGPGMELSDLIQEGMQGLIRGAEKFDASKGFRFSTYSHWWIKQAIRKSVLEQSQIIRLPAHMVEANYRVKECRRRLRAQLKRRPTNEEIALDTAIPLKRINAVVSLPKYTVSLDSKVGSTDLTYQEITADPSAETAEEMLNRWLMKKDVNRALDSLTVREKQVVRWRFGLDDGMLRTLHEIGQLMGVSRERIRQIESGAFRKLRNKKRVKSLKHYLEPVDNW